MQLDLSLRMERVVRRLFSSRLDFLLICLVSLLLLLLIAFQPWTMAFASLRFILSFAYVLFFPGYCLTVALFPYAQDLNSIERTGFSLVLSVAWVPVLAFILDRLPWGLRVWPILFGEMSSTFIFMSIGLWRQAHMDVEQAYTPDFSWDLRPWWRRLPPAEKRVYQVIFGALIVAVLAVAWAFLVPAPAEFMTEFYILGREGLAENYPRDAAVDQPLQVTLGITNRERSQVTYHVEIWVEDLWEPGRRQRVIRAGPLTLARGENREWPITWRMPWPGQDQKVEFQLFIGDNPEPYRRLHIFLNVNPG